jgi:hypothetical protein
MITDAPASANALAVARPMPPPEPVTKATFPSNDFMKFFDPDGLISSHAPRSRHPLAEHAEHQAVPVMTIHQFPRWFSAIDHCSQERRIAFPFHVDL